MTTLIKAVKKPIVWCLIEKEPRLCYNMTIFSISKGGKNFDRAL